MTGAAKHSIKEARGKATNDAKTEAEGQSDKTVGNVRNAVGIATDAA